MQKLNVQVNDDLFDLVETYAKRYRISRAAAVSCLLSYALDTLMAEIELIKRERASFKRGGSG